MSFFRWLQRLSGTRASEHASVPRDARAEKPDRDGFEAVRELSRHFTQDGVFNQPSPFINAGADIPLALGNLFRAQGDIDRAVALREAVLARDDTDRAVRARTLYELGCDYRKAGFLDRALDAYKEAQRLGYTEFEVSRELAGLFADSGDFTAAAAEYAALGMANAQAYYLVRSASESAADGNDDAAVRFLKQAVSAYPGSPEAWLALASISLLGKAPEKTLKHLRTGLEQGTASGRLILLEGLYSFARGPAAPGIAPDVLVRVASGLGDFLGGLEQDLTLCYYAGLFLQMTAQIEAAEQWFTKCLVLDPDFWAARLALLALTASRAALPPLLEQQVAFFTEQGARSKRFTCPPCGLRRDTVFSLCPRCLAWHSAAFRLRLT